MQKLSGWTGYRIQRIDWPDTPGGTVEIHLSPIRKTLGCARRGHRSMQVLETVQRRVRDLSLFEHRVVLSVPRRRLWCALRRPATRAAGLDRTLPTPDQPLCRGHQYLEAVAGFYGLGWRTVKAVDKTRLTATLLEPDWAAIRYLAMDEFALHEGHRYAMVVIKRTRRQVLWIGLGRSRATTAALFKQLPAGLAEQIEAVAIDMTTSHELEIRAHCPQAEIVYGLFHVVARYGRKVIDRVRVDEANRPKADRPARRVIKSSRWLLLRNRDRLQPAPQVRLDERLAANRSLLTIYLLRDGLKQLWRQRHAHDAEQAWAQWHAQAMVSGIEALQSFAERLKPYWHGIISGCRHPPHTSVLEGINNTIKVIKRRAYGYRDQAYFFLTIRAAFPVLLDEPLFCPGCPARTGRRRKLQSPTTDQCGPRAKCRKCGHRREPLQHASTATTQSGLPLVDHRRHWRNLPSGWERTTHRLH